MNAVLLVATALSLLLATVASTVAWRVTHQERRRSNARVAALTREIYGDIDDAEEGPVWAASAVRYGFVAIGAILVVAVVVTLSLWRDPSRLAGATGLNGPSHNAVGTTSNRAEVPIELLALEHERDGNQLVVRGLVRNPANGAARQGLTAVVLAYARTGDLVASGRAAVLAATLAPGETTPFVVNVAGADTIDRVRVSFRTGARVDAHVDRRAHADIAKEVDP